jgi:DNA-binding transcriptional LysR family regulator
MKRLNALSLRQLRALQAVASTGSISRAAEELSLTPPAVHSQLRLLEENFRCALLDRSAAGGFVPTPEGQVLLEAYDRAWAGLTLAIHRIDALQRGQTGTVVLGVVSTAKYFAPGLVARIKAAHPGIDIVLQVGNRDLIMARLSDGALDLAIMGRPPRDPPVTAALLGDHPHVIIAPRDHPLAQRGILTADEILSNTFLMREPGSGTRILAMRYLDQLGEGRPFVAVEMDSNETIKQAVMAGLGTAILSFHTVHDELAHGRLTQLAAPGMPLTRKWFVIHRADQPPRGAVATVLDFVVALDGAFLPRLDST